MVLQLSAFYSKECFGNYRCWQQVKNKCPIREACRLKRVAEDKKKPTVEVR